MPHSTLRRNVQHSIFGPETAAPPRFTLRRLPVFASVAVVCLATSAISETATQTEQNAAAFDDRSLDWSGPYAGGFLGFGVGDYGGELVGGAASFPDDGKGPLDGATFGVAFGYNYRTGDYVYGAELGLMSTDLSGSEPCGNPAFSCNFEIDAIATLSGRFGYVPMDNLMVYGSAGLAWASTTASTEGPPDTSTDANMTGFVLGVGLEYALSDQLSLNTSLRHYEFNDQDYVVSAIPETARIDASHTRLEMGLFFHF